MRIRCMKTTIQFLRHSLPICKLSRDEGKRDRSEIEGRCVSPPIPIHSTNVLTASLVGKTCLTSAAVHHASALERAAPIAKGEELVWPSTEMFANTLAIGLPQVMPPVKKNRHV